MKLRAVLVVLISVFLFAVMACGDSDTTTTTTDRFERQWKADLSSAEADFDLLLLAVSRICETARQLSIANQEGVTDPQFQKAYDGTRSGFENLRVIYLSRNAVFDDTLRQRAVDEGLISEEELPLKNVKTAEEFLADSDCLD